MILSSVFVWGAPYLDTVILHKDEEDLAPNSRESVDSLCRATDAMTGVCHRFKARRLRRESALVLNIVVVMVDRLHDIALSVVNRDRSAD